MTGLLPRGGSKSVQMLCKGELSPAVSAGIRGSTYPAEPRLGVPLEAQPHRSSEAALSSAHVLHKQLLDLI